jgi:hypothetical protein
MSTKPKETITLTFGESAENHKGMQVLGSIASRGISTTEMAMVKTQFETLGFRCQLYDLAQIPLLGTTNLTPNTHNTPSLKLAPAQLLVIKRAITNSAALYEEQAQLPRDTKALMYGRVVNKKARHNLCFSDFDQTPDYPNGKGTVINFSKTPHLAAIRASLPEITKLLQLATLQCEANYYYDPCKTYIGWHGDSERRIVVGIRLGATFPLHYRWYHKGAPISEVLSLSLEDGDMYFMSDKATGNDWKSSSRPTLRHAAGDLKWIDK